MRKAIIDIGSNSVRIAVFDGEVIFRDKITSRLGEGMTHDNLLQEKAISRTVEAVKKFVAVAEDYGVDSNEIYPFATAAVRNSKNGQAFINAAKNVVNRPIDVLSGFVEGEVAMLGALSGGDGAVVDIGGASTELTVAKGGKIVYSKSLPIGAVVLFDMCGEDRAKLESVIAEKISAYRKDVKVDELIAIGGTSTTCAFLSKNLHSFDRNLTNNAYIPRKKLAIIVERLFSLSETQRVEFLHIEKKRASIICGGALLLLKILEKYNLDGVKVSENDNLEGYYSYLEGKRYEK